MAASTTSKESKTPPPIIGKMGRYTVFVTPPSTPEPPQRPSASSTCPKISPSNNPTCTSPQMGTPKISPLHVPSSDSSQTQMGSPTNNVSPTHLQTPSSDFSKKSSDHRAPLQMASPKISSLLQKPPTSDSPKIDSPKISTPPQQFNNNKTYNKHSATQQSNSSLFGLFWNAVAKVQHVHSSMDEYLADWFGLDQSKYQWALNDYYETKGIVKEASKSKETASKV